MGLEMPPIPDTPIGLAAFALFLVAQVALRALQLRAHSRHEERKAQHAAAMAAAPDEGRRAIVAAHRPDPPPGFGPLLVLLALGALLGLVVAAARGEQRLVGRWLSADAMATVTRSICSSSKDCASGSVCDRGRCTPPSRIAEIKEGTLCTGCEPLPWMMTPVPALAVR
jgi:hypothetical protein